jgi:hypothetical protein
MTLNYCCSCSIANSKVCIYKSKLLTTYQDDNYCDECFIKIEKYEDDLIKCHLSLNKPLNSIIKPNFYKDYVKSPLPIYNTIKENDKEYVVIDKDIYYQFIINFNDRIVSKIETDIKETKKIITKINKSQEREEAEIRKIQDKQERDKQKEIKNQEREQEQIEIRKRENERINKIKEEVVKPFLKRPIKSTQKIEAIKCDKCKEYKCYPFQYENNNKWCDVCDEEIMNKKEDKKIDCACGITYFNMSLTHEERHLNSKQHKLYETSLLNKVDFTIHNIKKLQEIVKNNNLNINNYTRMSKKDLIAELKQFYKDGKITIF